MDEQLPLIEVPSSWKLDERTRRIGLRGVAEARAALLAHHRADDDEVHGDRQRPAA